MDLWMREARLFKYGSGTGSNFSNSVAKRKALQRRQVFRLLSFLKIGIGRERHQIGGTTRRALKCDPRGRSP